MARRIPRHLTPVSKELVPTEVLFGGTLGCWIYDEKPTGHELTGGLLILTGAALLALGKNALPSAPEAQRGKMASKASQPLPAGQSTPMTAPE
jgi:hypothetical protein